MHDRALLGHAHFVTGGGLVDSTGWCGRTISFEGTTRLEHGRSRTTVWHPQAGKRCWVATLVTSSYLCPPVAELDGSPRRPRHNFPLCAIAPGVLKGLSWSPLDRWTVSNQESPCFSEQ